MKKQEGDFKRPDHDDFRDSGELKKKEFSGIRQNSISGDTEIWILGTIEARVSEGERMLDVHAVERAYAEVFGLPNVTFHKPK